MKKLSKIRLVELPKKSLLNDDEQSSILGGSALNCIGTYDDCGFIVDSTCKGTFNDAPCSDGKSNTNCVGHYDD